MQIYLISQCRKKKKKEPNLKTNKKNDKKQTTTKLSASGTVISRIFFINMGNLVLFCTSVFDCGAHFHKRIVALHVPLHQKSCSNLEF